VGKWAIHPSQIDIANEVFAPTAKEIADAKAAVAAVREAEAAGAGAGNLNGMMIDAATARIFEGVLERARQAGLLE
jgi:citrate lyase subunit beta/citryl-CoA lyase